MTKTTITAILLAFFSQSGFSQELDKAKLDQYFQALESNDKFMGSVAISQNGKIIYAKSSGFSDVETKAKADENTKYRIGSISKTFTSALTFKAVEEGKLKLDTKLDTYYPKIKNAKNIRLGDLLNHRSGIHNMTDDTDFLTYNTQKKSEAEMVAIIENGGSDFEPDSKAEYSNSNYVLLSYILQKVYKKPYAELLEEKIIKPLGLKNTYVGSKIALAKNEGNSYTFGGEWTKESETDMSIPMGAGAVVSTPSDLTKFADALFGGKIVSAKSLEQMETLRDDYGMGLFQMPFYDKKSFGHTGGIDGFSSLFGYFPADKVGFALTSNGSNYDNNAIAIVLLSAVFNKPYEIPTFTTFKLTAEELNQYTGVYASKQIPIKITISTSGNGLMAQATGQSAFPLDATEKDKFKFDQAGIVIEFTPAEKQLVLKQGGGAFTFTKE